MPRPRKSLPPQSPSDPNQVVDYIAKAKALVAKVSAQKRKSDDGDGAKATPATKPKACVVSASPPTEAPKAIPAVHAKVVAAPPPPTRVRGKSPANETVPVAAAKPKPAVAPPSAPPAKASGLPAPCLGPKVCPPPPKADSPGASSASSAFDRTREVLLKAKGAKLTAEGKATPPPKVNQVPKAVPKVSSGETNPAEPKDVYVTPPPKQSNFASPKSTTPVAPMKRLDSYESDEFCCSQREYYGRKGQSWWGQHSGWDYHPYHNWYYDHAKGRYVFTHGPEAWVWDGPWEENWWETNNEEANQSPEDSPDASNGDRVWNALAHRKPSTIATSPGEDAPMTPESEVVTTFPPDVSAEQEASDSTSHGTPVHESDACAPETNEAHEPEPSDSVPAEPAPPAETPHVPEAGSHVARAKEAPAAGEDNKWRCDKHGNLLNPEALYMRFYRRIRSDVAA